MIQLIYVSTATRPMDADGLAELLHKARTKNDEDDVTGMLLYHDGSFFQVLEGEPEAVRRVFRRVEQDPRHRMVTVLMEQEVERRAFADWSMAFRNVRDFDPSALPGFSDFLLRGANEDEFSGSAEAWELMRTFRQYLR